MVFDERLDRVSGFLDLGAVADERDDGGRRGGRVELRYALAEKSEERNGARAGSERGTDEDEVVVETAGGATGAWEAIKTKLMIHSPGSLSE